MIVKLLELNKENNTVYYIKKIVVFKDKCAKLLSYSTVFDNPTYDQIITRFIYLNKNEIEVMQQLFNEVSA